MARPRFSPTAEQRKVVELMAGFGIPEEKIAQVIGEKGIDAKTLRKHFRRELDIGATKLITAVAQALSRLAISGKSAAAAIFILKVRAGWRETTVVEHTGPQGGPMEILHGDLDERITAELDSFDAAGEEEEIPGTVDDDTEDGAGT